jgi:hypothetical protein
LDSRLDRLERICIQADIAGKADEGLQYYSDELIAALSSKTGLILEDRDERVLQKGKKGRAVYEGFGKGSEVCE